MKRAIKTMIYGLLVTVFITSCATSGGIFTKRKYRGGVYHEDISYRPEVKKYDNENKPKAVFPKQEELHIDAIEVKTPIAFSEIELNTNKTESPKPIASIGKEDNHISQNLIQQFVSKNKELKKQFQLRDDDKPEKKGNKRRNWAAVLGFILSFFVPFIAIWFCLIGLKSQHKTLAFIGMMICLVIMIAFIALTFGLI